MEPWAGPDYEPVHPRGTDWRGLLRKLTAPIVVLAGLLAKLGSLAKFATVFVAFVALYKQDYVSIGESIALGAVIAVAAPLGDLFESAVKRDMQVKDSGRLLGGHGGMLDRLDAPLFAAVASYYVLRAFGAT